MWDPSNFNFFQWIFSKPLITRYVQGNVYSTSIESEHHDTTALIKQLVNTAVFCLQLREKGRVSLDDR